MCHVQFSYRDFIYTEVFSAAAFYIGFSSARGFFSGMRKKGLVEKRPCGKKDLWKKDLVEKRPSKYLDIGKKTLWKKGLVNI